MKRPRRLNSEDVFKDWAPDQARQRLDEALKDPRFAEWRAAYGDPQNPDHELAKREFGRLHEISYPEPAVEAAGASPAGRCGRAMAARRRLGHPHRARRRAGPARSSRSSGCTPMRSS